MVVWARRDEREGMEHPISSARGATLEALPQLLAIEPQKLRGCIIFASALTPQSRLLELTEALPLPADHPLHEARRERSS